MLLNSSLFSRSSSAERPSAITWCQQCQSADLIFSSRFSRHPRWCHRRHSSKIPISYSITTTTTLLLSSLYCLGRPIAIHYGIEFHTEEQSSVSCSKKCRPVRPRRLLFCQIEIRCQYSFCALTGFRLCRQSMFVCCSHSSAFTTTTDVLLLGFSQFIQRLVVSDLRDFQYSGC